MSDVYVPGLVAAADASLVRTITFATGGHPAVAAGDAVEASSIVGYQNPRGYLHFVDVARELDCVPSLLSDCLCCREGDRVREGEVVARMPGVFGLLTKEARAPVDGTVERISIATGKLAIRADPVPVRAFLPGQIVRADPAGGVEIRARGALVEGVFGLGPEAAGPIAVRTGGPDRAAEPDALGPADRGAVVLAGAHASASFLERAAAAGVAAVVAGGAHLADLEALCGRPLGLVVSGGEPVPFGVVLTEGFGAWPVAPRAFSMLAALAGRAAYVSPQTQVRAGVVRPRVMVPRTGDPGDPGVTPLGRPEAEAGLLPESLRPTGGLAAGAPPSGLAPGTRVRVVGGPYFGRTGRVAALTPGAVAFTSEVRARAALVALDGGGRATVARRNLELLEG